MPCSPSSSAATRSAALTLHDARRIPHREHGAQVVDLELLLQVFASDVADRRKARRGPGRVEQAVEPAVLQHRASERGREARFVAHVHAQSQQPARIFRCQRTGHRLRALPVEIRHDDVRALFHEAPGRRLTDAAGAADDEGHVPRQQALPALARDTLLHLAPLERPVLELEDVGFRDEPELAHRLGVLDRVHHVEGCHHTDARHQHDLGPVFHRLLAGRRVARVVLLVAHAALAELIARSLQQLRLASVEVQLDPQRQAAGAQDVLGRGHAALGQLPEALGSQALEDLRRVVEVQDDAIRFTQRAADHRQQQLRALAPKLGARGGDADRSECPSALLRRRQVRLHFLDRPEQPLVALAGVVPPDNQAVVREGQADRPLRNPGRQLQHRLRQRKAGPRVRHVEDLALEELPDELLRQVVAQVGEAHGGDVVGVGDHAVGENRVKWSLHARQGVAGIAHAVAHELHHVLVAHVAALAQPREALHRQPGEAGASDRPQVGPAALDQQPLLRPAICILAAYLDRGIAAPRLHEARLEAHPIGEGDDLVQLVGALRRSAGPSVLHASLPSRFESPAYRDPPRFRTADRMNSVGRSLHPGITRPGTDRTMSGCDRSLRADTRGKGLRSRDT
jgi:hypothetical protein